MKRTSLVAALLLAGSLLGGAETASPPSDDTIDAAVKGLGADSPDVREAAFAWLLAWGAGFPEEVLARLPEKEEDPEIFRQCAVLREKFEEEAFRLATIEKAKRNPEFVKDFGALMAAVSDKPVGDGAHILQVFHFHAKNSRDPAILEAFGDVCARLFVRRRIGGADMPHAIDAAGTEALAWLHEMKHPGLFEAARVLVEDVTHNGKPEIGSDLYYFAELRGAAMCALVLTRHPRAVEIARARLSDPLENSHVREAALGAFRDPADPGAFKVILAHLEDPNGWVRLAALECVQVCLKREHAGPLMAAFDRFLKGQIPPDSSGQTGYQAYELMIDLLGKAGDPAAAPLLAEGIRKAAATGYTRVMDHNLCVKAAIAIGNLGDRAHVGVLEALLEDPDEGVRQAARKAIERLRSNGPGDIARTVRDLGSAEFEAREAAFRTLLEIGAGDPDAVLAALPDAGADPEILSRCAVLRERIPLAHLRRGILDAPGLDPAFVRAAGALLDAPDPGKMSALGQWAAARPVLVARAAGAFLGHPDEAMRLAALDVAAWTKEPSLVPALLPLAAEGNSREIRIAAINALAGIDRPEARAGVFAALFDPDHAVRAAAIAATRSIRDPETAQRLLARLPEEDLLDLKAAVILALRPHANDPAVRGTVLALLRDGSPIVRGAALDAISPGNGGTNTVLALMPGTSANAFADEAVRDLLLGLLPEEKDAGLRARLIRSLDAWTQTAGTRKAALGFLEDPDGNVRMQAAWHLSRGKPEPGELDRVLACFEREPLPHVRSAIVMAVGFSGNPEVAVPFLARNLRSPDEGVALSAIHALSLCGQEDAAGALAGFVDPRDGFPPGWGTRLDEALAVLEQIRGRRAIPALARLLTTRDPAIGLEVRFSAALALLASAGESPDDLEDGEITEAARIWWEAHRNDPEFMEAR